MIRDVAARQQTRGFDGIPSHVAICYFHHDRSAAADKGFGGEREESVAANRGLGEWREEEPV